jgi:hypothetical protein
VRRDGGGGGSHCKALLGALKTNSQPVIFLLGERNVFLTPAFFLWRRGWKQAGGLHIARAGGWVHRTWTGFRSGRGSLMGHVAAPGWPVSREAVPGRLKQWRHLPPP